MERYEMTDEQVLQEAQFALDAGYGSVAIQGGERTDSAFVERITRLIHQIRRLQPGGAPLEQLRLATSTGCSSTSAPLNDLGITLSLGEQQKEVYREWFQSGAGRYLLRIEASDRELYEKLHPADRLHSYDTRIQALEDLKSVGYLLGSGIMIGLPFQTYTNLDADLQFLKNLQVDMVGMGPYIPHKDTPLGKIVEYWKGERDTLPDTLLPLASQPHGDFWNFSKEQLLELSLDMIARLRILMPHINIAATTALQVLHPDGREMALLSGANVIMPNMTEKSLRGNYSLYEGKQGVADDAASTRDKLLENLLRLNIPVGWHQKGDWR